MSIDAGAATVLERLAAFAAEARLEDEPKLREDACSRVLDTLGVALAAAGTESADAVREVVDGWLGTGGTPGTGTAGLFGGGRAPAAIAALHNGTLAHSLDFDDTHLPSVLHPSASVVPAALAVAEAVGADGEQLLRAVGVGDEVVVRLGMAGYLPHLGTSTYFESGFHATAICGAVGCAAAAALLLGLDRERIGHAIAISCSLGSGILEANRSGGSVKPLHCGWAAHAGITAAEMARAGMTGPPTAIEGRFGLLRAFSGEEFDVDAVTDGLGEHWLIVGSHFKPYPCNHFTHAIVDGALKLRGDGLTPAMVDSVELRAPQAVLKTIAEPPEVKANPPSAHAARFSGPFVFALALSGGGGLGVYLDDFTEERAHDPGLRALAARATCVGDAECDEIFPDELPAIVRVLTRDGDRLEARTMANRGGARRPLSAAELATKFRLNCERAIGAEAAVELERSIWSLAEGAPVARVVGPALAPTGKEFH